MVVIYRLELPIVMPSSDIPVVIGRLVFYSLNMLQFCLLIIIVFCQCGWFVVFPTAGHDITCSPSVCIPDCLWAKIWTTTDTGTVYYYARSLHAEHTD